jgi:hypothetical protein
MAQKTAFDELMEISNWVEKTHKKTIMPLYIPPFEQALEERLKAVIFTPAQVNLLHKNATPSLQHIFTVASTEAQPDQEKIREAFIHATRDPLMKVCAYFDFLAEMQGYGVPLDPQQKENALGAVQTLTSCVADILVNCDTVVPQKSGAADDYSQTITDYKTKILPRLAMLPPSLAQEFGISGRRMDEILITAQKDYDQGKEHIRALHAQDWKASL